jgi:hypothetical protein
MKINTNEIKEIIKKFTSQLDKDATIFLVLLMLILGFGFSQLVFPGITQIINNNTQLAEKRANIELIQKKLEKRQEKQVVEKKLPVLVYKTVYKGLELENAAEQFVEKIIEIIKNDGNNKILELKFEKKPAEDDFGVKSNDHEILNLKLVVESTFKSTQDFLNDIYLLNYLVVLKNVLLIPVKGNERVNVYIELDLLINNS